jgi:hypothetical protein
MRNSGITLHRRRGERGQTIILVAVSLVTLLAMAALAIDVVTLYVARGEMQRAADAAALAGAKAFVDSGVTSDPTNASRQALAQTMATQVIRDILLQNRVSGVGPSQVAGSPAFDFTRPGNPQVTVSIQRTNLPTFFSRIWGSRVATVSASAVAEAYNASNSQISTGNYVPITPKCVKPLLVANQDPATTSGFIDVTSGAAVATNVVGEQITLYPACTGTGGVGTCTVLNPNPPKANSPVPGPAHYLNYIAAQVTPNANNLCPTCSGVPDFEQSVECCDFNAYSCGAAAVKIFTDTTIRHGQLRNETNNGVQCLIGGGAADTLDPTSLPGFSAGTEPVRITAGSGPLSGNLVTTSNSIVNLPIIDTTNPLPTTPGAQVTVIGFLQVFIDGSNTVPSPPAGNHAEVQAHILNVVGCGNAPAAGAPVSGGGVSPIPVRLIHQ